MKQILFTAVTISLVLGPCLTVPNAFAADNSRKVDRLQDDEDDINNQIADQTKQKAALQKQLISAKVAAETAKQDYLSKGGDGAGPTSKADGPVDGTKKDSWNTPTDDADRDKAERSWRAKQALVDDLQAQYDAAIAQEKDLRKQLARDDDKIDDLQTEKKVTDCVNCNVGVKVAAPNTSKDSLDGWADIIKAATPIALGVGGGVLGYLGMKQSSSDYRNYAANQSSLGLPVAAPNNNYGGILGAALGPSFASSLAMNGYGNGAGNMWGGGIGIGGLGGGIGLGGLGGGLGILGGAGIVSGIGGGIPYAVGGGYGGYSPYAGGISIGGFSPYAGGISIGGYSPYSGGISIGGYSPYAIGGGIVSAIGGGMPYAVGGISIGGYSPYSIGGGISPYAGGISIGGYSPYSIGGGISPYAGGISIGGYSPYSGGIAIGGGIVSAIGGGIPYAVGGGSPYAGGISPISGGIGAYPVGVGISPIAGGISIGGYSPIAGGISIGGYSPYSGGISIGGYSPYAGGIAIGGGISPYGQAFSGGFGSPISSGYGIPSGYGGGYPGGIGGGIGYGGYPSIGTPYGGVGITNPYANPSYGSNQGCYGGMCSYNPYQTTLNGQYNSGGLGSLYSNQTGYASAATRMAQQQQIFGQDAQNSATGLALAQSRYQSSLSMVNGSVYSGGYPSYGGAGYYSPYTSYGGGITAGGYGTNCGSGVITGYSGSIGSGQPCLTPYRQ